MDLTNIIKNRAKKILAVDFGCSAIKAAYVEYTESGLAFLGYDLKNVASANLGGEEAAADFIEGFIKNNSIPDKDVVLSISDENSLIIKYLSLPVLPEAEVSAAAKWQVKDETSFDLESALSAWQLVREYTDEEGAKKNGIIFTAASKEIVERHLSIIHNCGLNPVKITTGPFNYANLLKYYPPASSSVAILDIGGIDAVLSIYSQNKLCFVRRLSFSSEKLVQALTVPLVSEEGKIEFSLLEAAQLKDAFGIPEDVEAVIRDNVKAVQIVYLMRPLLEGLVKELKFSFDYFNSNFEIIPSLLYLTGGGSNLKNLDKYISREAKLKVSYLSLPDFIDTAKIDKEKLAKEKNQLTDVLGASLGGLGEINLLPAQIREEKNEAIQKSSLRFIAIVTGVIFLSSLFFAKLQARDYQKRLKTTCLHLGAITGIKELKEKIDSRQNLIAKIQEGKVPVDGLLKLISASVPQEVILDELYLDQAAHSLVLKGNVLASEDVAEDIVTKFIQRLEGASFFSEVSMTSLKNAGLQRRFELKCDLAH